MRSARSVAARSVAARSVAARSVAARSVAARSVAARSVAARSVAVGAFVACCVAMVSGTASAATLDTGATRRDIARQVGATYQGLAFGNVACPSGVPRKRGNRFTCTVQLPGTFLVFDATQSDGRGTVSFETAQAVITKQAVEAFVAANASLAATVTCGTAAWLVVRPGQPLTCQASLADGSVRTVQLTVRDTAGNVTITSVT